MGPRAPLGIKRPVGIPDRGEAFDERGAGWEGWDRSAVGCADAHLRPDEAGPKMGHRIRSGLDVYGGAGGGEGVEFVDLGVGEGDAAVGPVDEAVEGAEEGDGGEDAVDFDVGAGLVVGRGGLGAVVVVGVAEVESLVEAADGLASVDEVVAFGGAVVALLLLGAGDSAEGYGVGLEELAVGVGAQGVFGFGDDDVVDGRGGCLEGEEEGQGRDERHGARLRDEWADCYWLTGCG